ncbi:hypothetical protein ACFQVD_44820 [Streptosporangium amethystogenes subsp. fukuiense]|uniref:Uncharacterized protein n=1 Tax=Streptosporangium amethystogenes subsp. fukuiense TaxID=698418 RepID=A0ABW2TI74_9ACTN
MEPDAGQKMKAVIEETAAEATAIVSSVRAEIAALPPDTQESIGALLADIESTVAEIAAMPEQIPVMEKETAYIARVRADQEAQGQYVPAPDDPEYPEWEAAVFKVCPCAPGAVSADCPIHD